MSSLLLYDDITLLNRERHRNLRLKPSSGFAFAADTHYVPIAAQEFYQAARDYPILFVGDEKTLIPIALLGLEAGQNLHVDDQGRWTPSTYVPAFIRRYPFVLAASNEERFSVCFDAAHDGWNEEEGETLFDKDGKNTRFLDEVIEFLKGYTAEMERTRELVETLVELDLLVQKTLRLTRPDGSTYRIDDFHAVDEERFGKLEDDQVLALHHKGYLGLVYAHLMSLGSANRLFDRHLHKKGEIAESEAPSGESPVH